MGRLNLGVRGLFLIPRNFLYLILLLFIVMSGIVCAGIEALYKPQLLHLAALCSEMVGNHYFGILAYYGAEYSQTKITTQEASKHIGDTIIVLDKVYGGKLLAIGMTLLNVRGEFHNHLLVVMIRP